MGQHFTREPVQTYEQALWHLIGLWDDCFAVTERRNPLPPEAELVCLMFWVGDAQFRADIRRMWNSMFQRNSRYPCNRRRAA